MVSPLSVTYLRCNICRATRATDQHHIRTRGAGGSDEPHNILNLCRICHGLWHAKGFKHIIHKFPHVWLILEENGWFIEDHFGKWYLCHDFEPR